MTTYEYRRLTDPSETELNALGADGWRVCGMVDMDYEFGRVIVVLMERALSAGAQPL